jgi:hypothetical protein
MATPTKGQRAGELFTFGDIEPADEERRELAKRCSRGSRTAARR